MRALVGGRRGAVDAGGVHPDHDREPAEQPDDHGDARRARSARSGRDVLLRVHGVLSTGCWHAPLSKMAGWLGQPTPVGVVPDAHPAGRMGPCSHRCDTASAALGTTIAGGALAALSQAPERASRLLRHRYPTVAVTGMTGVGKTRLADRLSRRASSQSSAEAGQDVGSAVMERRTRRTTPAARLPVPGGAGRERRHPPRRARRGLPRRAGRRRAARRRQRLRHPAAYGRDERRRARHPRGAAGRRARGLVDHRPPDRQHGRTPRAPDVAGHRGDQGRPLRRRHRRRRRTTTPPAAGRRSATSSTSCAPSPAAPSSRSTCCPVCAQGGGRKSPLPDKAATELLGRLELRLAQLSGHV